MTLARILTEEVGKNEKHLKGLTVQWIMSQNGQTHFKDLGVFATRF